MEELTTVKAFVLDLEKQEKIEDETKNYQPTLASIAEPLIEHRTHREVNHSPQNKEEVSEVLSRFTYRARCPGLRDGIFVARALFKDQVRRDFPADLFEDLGSTAPQRWLDPQPG